MKRFILCAMLVLCLTACKKDNQLEAHRSQMLDVQEINERGRRYAYAYKDLETGEVVSGFSDELPPPKGTVFTKMIRVPIVE